jgi:hypothetical protein
MQSGNVVTTAKNVFSLYMEMTSDMEDGYEYTE